MNKVCVMLLALVCSSCCTTGTMNFCRFDGISIGDEICEIERCYGPPFCVHEYEDGTMEYVYIERTKLGPEYGEQTNYYITVEDGKVTDKCMECMEEPMDIIYTDQSEPW